VLEDAAKQLLAPFIARVVYDRPYVTLKWAETADGKVAGPDGKRIQISNSAATKVVHQLRARSDAIMVGVNTVFSDDPMLTARDVPATATGPRKLLRVVLDSALQMPLSSKLVRTARQVRTFAYFDARLADAERSRIRALRDAGVEPVIADRSSSGLNLEQILVSLGGFDATHVLVECGPTLARGFFARQNLVDRVWVIHSPMKVSDATAPAGVGVPGEFVKTGELDLAGDRLSEYLNPASPVYFAPEPSADLTLAAEGA
jgi:diaminohydroxyphosphoribosylaminopyrimidine deaminase/5-amino-6-(5-phosphoribosylamino)uracil reductase